MIIELGRGIPVQCVGVRKERGAPLEAPVEATIITPQRGSTEVVCPKLQGDICTAADLEGQVRCVRITPDASRERAAGTRLSVVTNKALEIVRLTSFGMTDTEIGTALTRSPKGVSTDQRRIQRKCGVLTREQLAALAIESGEVDVAELAATFDFTLAQTLTARELEILQELARTEGTTNNRAIGRRLTPPLAETTVNKYMDRASGKIDVHNRTQLVGYFLLAQRMGLLEQPAA